MSDIKEIEYAQSFFNSGDIRYWAEKFVALIPEGTKVIVSTGSSGCSIASAMLMICSPQLRHCYFSKSKETSHNGGKSGIFLEEDAGHIVIVDDFVSGGNTIRRIVKEITTRVPEAGGVGNYTIPVILANIWDEYRVQPLADELNLKFIGCDNVVVSPTVVPPIKVPEVEEVKSFLPDVPKVVFDMLTEEKVKNSFKQECVLDYLMSNYAIITQSVPNKTITEGMLT